MASFTNAPGQSFRQPKSTAAKTFSLTWDRLGTLLEQYQHWDPVDASEINSIVLDELYDLGRYVAVPTYQKWAPVKMGIEGGTDITVQAARTVGKAGFRSSPQFWSHHGKHLLEQIQAIRSTEPLGMSVRMPWFGLLTVEGRPGLPDRPANHPYLIELDGGQVIYSTKVGPATTREGSGGSAGERMAWAANAYREIQRAGWVAQAGKNIEIRAFIEVIFPGLRGDAAKTQLEQYSSGWQKEYKPVDDYRGAIIQQRPHTAFTDYHGLRRHAREGARPGSERKAQKIREALTGRRLTREHEALRHESFAAGQRARHPHATPDDRRAYERLKLRLRRSEEAIRHHSDPSTIHIPFYRHR